MTELGHSPADPFARIGLTYDDVLLLPGETDVIPSGYVDGGVLPPTVPGFGRVSG